MDKYLESFFKQSWWVITFALLCMMLFEQGMAKRNIEYLKLAQKKQELEMEKTKLSTTQQKLMMQINSQSDPSWVELVLIQGLGLVPEDHTKVYFP